MKTSQLYLQLQSTALPSANQRPTIEYLRNRQMNDQDPLEPPADHQGIGIAVLKRTFNLYRADTAGKYRNSS